MTQYKLEFYYIKQDYIKYIRQFDEKMKLDRERLELDKYKSKEDIRLKEKSINKKV